MYRGSWWNFSKNNWIKNASRWSNIVRCFLSISQRARMSARGCHASSLGLMPFSGSGFTSMPIGNSKWSGTRLIARGKKSFGAEFKQPWHWHPAFSKDLFTAMFSITIYFANFYFAYSCFRLLPQTWLSFRQSEHKSKEVTRLSGNLWKRLHAYNWCLRPHPRMFNVSHPVNSTPPQTFFGETSMILKNPLKIFSQSLKVDKTRGKLNKSLMGSQGLLRTFAI